ncbi:hypothetical protein LOK49_LG04G00380 [Camellia lanceoleosa]|uniref:Uncharacterized protein n=1 Tax=Camellia lanceoleosa TaxID=1840588 RepID=A0ACC0HZE4_9ERIC|nr:hypothetical protein LOK49_LG04G00380 [Camellia lanceoleosa]
MRREHEDRAGMEDTDKELNVSLVEETDSNLEKSSSGGARAGVMMRAAHEEKHDEQGGNRTVDGEVITSDFMRSLSGSIRYTPGLNLEVVLKKAHEQNCDMGHASGVAVQPNCSDPNQDISNLLNQAQNVEKKQSYKKGSRGEASKSYQIRKASRKEKAKGVSGHYFNKKRSLQIGKNRKEMSMNLKKGAVFSRLPGRPAYGGELVSSNEIVGADEDGFQAVDFVDDSTLSNPAQEAKHLDLNGAQNGGLEEEFSEESSLIHNSQARNEGRDLAREGNEIIREASKWSPELAAACEVWKEIKFEFPAMDTL